MSFIFGVFFLPDLHIIAIVCIYYNVLYTNIYEYKYMLYCLLYTLNDRGFGHKAVYVLYRHMGYK